MKIMRVDNNNQKHQAFQAHWSTEKQHNQNVASLKEKIDIIGQNPKEIGKNPTEIEKYTGAQVWNALVQEDISDIKVNMGDATLDPIIEVIEVNGNHFFRAKIDGMVSELKDLPQRIINLTGHENLTEAIADIKGFRQEAVTLLQTYLKEKWKF